MPTTIQVCAILGAVLSGYALYVESQHAADPGYTALCDVNSWVACSKVFSSPYGHVMNMWFVEKDSPLNQPNAFYGILYYLAAYLHEVLAFIPGRRYLMAFVATFVAGFSVYLGYILVNVLGDVCIVCMSTYVLNAFILISAWRAVSGKKVSGKKRQ